MGAYIYSRSANPNRESFEISVAEMESAKYALSSSSGMAATAAVLQCFATSSHIITMGSLYGGTHRYLTHLAPAFGVKVSFVNDIETELGRVMSESEQEVTIVWVESPSNPTLSLVDIQAVADTAHAQGARVVVDHTFLSPYFQNPLVHGADFVLHSVTKYINGHCKTQYPRHFQRSMSEKYQDVLMGAVAFNCPEARRALSFIQNAAGSIPSSFDCWLAHRGLKTLHLRAPAAARIALAIAEVLSASPHVLQVNFPGGFMLSSTNIQTSIHSVKTWITSQNIPVMGHHLHDSDKIPV